MATGHRSRSSSWTTTETTSGKWRLGARTILRSRCQTLFQLSWKRQDICLGQSVYPSAESTSTTLHGGSSSEKLRVHQAGETSISPRPTTNCLDNDGSTAAHVWS